MLNVLLAIDQTLVRDGIKLLLESSGNIAVIDEASDVNELSFAIRNHINADIILLDLDLNQQELPNIIQKILDLNNKVKVVMLSSNANLKLIAALFEAGICGYLLKSVGKQELVFALNHVQKSGKYMCTEFSSKLLVKLALSPQSTIDETDYPTLFTDREMEVLQLIGEGLTNSEISEKLFLSKRTVEGHRQNLIDKTASRNTATLIRYALIKGLIN
ncbi:LuxR C-terminal-related transcriptional regulator [Pedobacter sp. PWIIR3]